MANESKPVIVALCRKCNGWVLLASPDDAIKSDKSLAGELLDCIKAGHKITEITVGDVRSGRVQMCECNRKAEQPALFSEAPNA